MSRKYRDAAAKLQQNVQKHLQEMKEYSSSEDEEAYDSSVLEGVLQSYTTGGGDKLLLKRTKNLLEEAISGRPVPCLICIGSIKRADALWTCEHCYTYYHLSCTQKWANDSISLRSEENHGPIQVVVQKKIEWCCPKCRHSYSKEEIPRKYKCFCGNTDDPPLHPWLIPHSCGEMCRKGLSDSENCNHRCMLLCHPGPCPPCPKMVTRTCYCGGEKKTVRCSTSNFSCGNLCNKKLTCKVHNCPEKCHEGECPPCLHTSVRACLCGTVKMERLCADTPWQCDTKCNKTYPCGYHKCQQVCHPGYCGQCLNSGLKTCPCGAEQKYVTCPEFMEPCMGTCGKARESCEHTCPEKCHNGPCPPCQVVIEKKCVCGAHVKSLPCSKEYKCDTKCRGIRPCGKHNCGRKCCSGNCPPCEKICDKPLQCGRHKCTGVCHGGPCYPCPRENKVTCRCKGTSVTVPCGRERHTKPPKCNRTCKLKYKCGHINENVHSCHFGDCPPCKAICSKSFPCGHSCHAICHEYVAVTFKQVEKPATPWEYQPPQTKIVTTDCPPCEDPVTMSCFGDHEKIDMPCHRAMRYSCGRNCEKPLGCMNHVCSLMCHFYEPNKDFPDVPSTCESCNRDCSKPRPQKCIHKCPEVVCHPGACPPCKIVRRIPCHCRVNELYFECFELNTANEEKLSCKQQCPKYLKCGHRCKFTCHSTECSIDQLCNKKTKVYCLCMNLKKEMLCHLVKEGKTVPCDETCEAKKAAAALEKEREMEQLRLLEEERNRRELEEYELKMGARKRKSKKKMEEVNEQNTFYKKHFYVIVRLSLAFFITAIYFLFFRDHTIDYW